MGEFDKNFAKLAQKIAREKGLRPLLASEIQWLWLNFQRFLDEMKAKGTIEKVEKAKSIGVEEAKKKLENKRTKLKEMLKHPSRHNVLYPDVLQGYINAIGDFLIVLGDLQKIVKELFEEFPEKYGNVAGSYYWIKEIDDWKEKAEKLLEPATK